MKTILLLSVIATIGISLTSLVFVYQHTQNCESQGGRITGFLQCNKNDYEIMQELFQQKYGPVHGFVIDGAYSKTELTALGADGSSITLTIKEGRNGPYQAELVCKNKDLGTTKIPLEDINRYLQHENCFSAHDKEPAKGSNAETSFPSYQEFNMTELTFENSCTKDMICYGVLPNGTKIRISCDDIVLHSCGVISFDSFLKPETILAVGDNAGNSVMNLEMIPENEYQIRVDSRKLWLPNPILDITDKELHPKVNAMLEQMWNFEGYTHSKYNKNVLEKRVNLNSTEWDHQSIYDWLKENHRKQFGGNVDVGFTNYFKYDGRIYSLSWAIAD